MSIEIIAHSPGERMIVALAVLSLCAELLSDDVCRPTPPTVAIEACVDLCDPLHVDSWGPTVCVCADPPTITEVIE